MNRPQPVNVNIAIGGLLSTGVALLAILWPERLSPELQAAIIAFGNTLILTVAAIIASRAVTPVAAPQLPEGTKVTVETAVGEPNRVTTL